MAYTPPEKLLPKTFQLIMCLGPALQSYKPVLKATGSLKRCLESVPLLFTQCVAEMQADTSRIVHLRLQRNWHFSRLLLAAECWYKVLPPGCPSSHRPKNLDSKCPAGLKAAETTVAKGMDRMNDIFVITSNSSSGDSTLFVWAVLLMGICLDIVSVLSAELYLGVCTLGCLNRSKGLKASAMWNRVDWVLLEREVWPTTARWPLSYNHHKCVGAQWCKTLNLLWL